ncbi:MAG: patatin-like phospholipase family protein [Georgenia sp.]
MLGGGASFGAGQVGMLHALADAGIQPDLVVGTSVGALNGALLAASAHDAVDRLEETWTQPQRRDVSPSNLLSVLWRLTQSTTHLVEAAGIEQVAARTLHARDFADLELPFAAVTLDLGTGHWALGTGHWARQGPGPRLAAPGAAGQRRDPRSLPARPRCPRWPRRSRSSTWPAPRPGTPRPSTSTRPVP